MGDIKYKKLKTFSTKFSGRSSDYIFPSIAQGCFGDCLYCYVSRHSHYFKNNILISENTKEIIEYVKYFKPENITKPNQTHDKYITWDISCNSDLGLIVKYIDYKTLFDYFKYSNRDFGTFATKFTNPLLLTYNSNRKIRVRVSLMPEIISNILEPKTSTINKRIHYINKLYNAGYEVHINFSPVIYFQDWENHYIKLFNKINSILNQDVKDQLKCEVIFLTHNEKLHHENINNKYEYLLWNPELQENKISQFGGNNVRYKKKLKEYLINRFKILINDNLNYCDIRYIF